MSKLTVKPPAPLSPGKGPVYNPQADADDCRGGDTWPTSNIGSGRVIEVRDRVPSNPRTPDRDSTQRRLKGRGLNPQSMLESSRENLNHGPLLEGDVDETGGFDGQDLRGIGGRGRD